MFEKHLKLPLVFVPQNSISEKPICEFSLDVVNGLNTDVTVMLSDFIPSNEDLSGIISFLGRSSFFLRFPSEV